MSKKCPKHPKYRGIRPPKSNCKTCWKFYQEIKAITDDKIALDRLAIQSSEKLRELSKKYKNILTENDDLKQIIQAMQTIKASTKRFTISQKKGGASEATAIIVASDWHFEENVRPETINNLNAFNIEIGKIRANNFWRNSLTLINLCKKDITINNILLVLLGDFITNMIHEELAETNLLAPIDACIEVQNILISGIEFLLRNTDCRLTIPCHSGNHGRTTARPRHSNEGGHSLEHFIYHNMAIHFANNPRVSFLIAQGYHTYINIYNMTIRIHHGHDIRYQGGVGGLYIPLNKAIAQWNKGCRADLDILGHFHQFRDGGNFIVNGSLIGYNAYALSIKAEFEKPRQAFFLIDKKRGKTIVAPILLDSN
ncbi:hypothetical protein GW933_02340 [Candidatus Falkowbacteria bacterium]|uniref:Calcineurin-like phosphoesterase domain-containing protein n=1 Tax=Candidatus Buchananbacteria bacterium CG10_big_fil_rev_8_21_14_0_10_33_19 TaxID=1974525 RepID=A0A2H0W684_9BACT|nr:hypothetical protein [Candidatus Falkowbacteria bacterium]PIS06150.1 MAG: hypothetical protein COT80_01095 [Candidatus Buchananbacteria bacterium CG10_big_fil_rev_8_21_14_0_10_33_19]